MNPNSWKRRRTDGSISFQQQVMFPFLRSDQAVGGGRGRGSQANPNMPAASFLALPQTNGFTVCFESTSSDPNTGLGKEGLDHSWMFNDGQASVSSDVDPCHVFPGPGTYPVVLVVRSPSGYESHVTRYITVGPAVLPPPGPVARLTASVEINPFFGRKSLLLSADAGLSEAFQGETIASYEYFIVQANTLSPATVSPDPITEPGALWQKLSATQTLLDSFAVLLSPLGDPDPFDPNGTPNPTARLGLRVTDSQGLTDYTETELAVPLPTADYNELTQRLTGVPSANPLWVLSTDGTEPISQSFDTVQGIRLHRWEIVQTSPAGTQAPAAANLSASRAAIYYEKDPGNGGDLSTSVRLTVVDAYGRDSKYKDIFFEDNILPGTTQPFTLAPNNGGVYEGLVTGCREWEIGDPSPVGTNPDPPPFAGYDENLLEWVITLPDGSTEAVSAWPYLVSGYDQAQIDAAASQVILTATYPVVDPNFAGLVSSVTVGLPDTAAECALAFPPPQIVSFDLEAFGRIHDNPVKLRDLERALVKHDVVATHANGLALTYSYRLVSEPPQTDPSLPETNYYDLPTKTDAQGEWDSGMDTPVVDVEEYLIPRNGDYTYEVTVTASDGQSATAEATFNFQRLLLWGTTSVYPASPLDEFNLTGEYAFQFNINATVFTNFLPGGSGNSWVNISTSTVPTHWEVLVTNDPELILPRGDPNRTVVNSLPIPWVGTLGDPQSATLTGPRNTQFTTPGVKTWSPNVFLTTKNFLAGLFNVYVPDFVVEDDPPVITSFDLAASANIYDDPARLFDYERVIVTHDVVASHPDGYPLKYSYSLVSEPPPDTSGHVPSIPPYDLPSSTLPNGSWDSGTNGYPVINIGGVLQNEIPRTGTYTYEVRVEVDGNPSLFATETASFFYKGITGGGTTDIRPVDPYAPELLQGDYTFNIDAAGATMFTNPIPGGQLGVDFAETPAQWALLPNSSVGTYGIAPAGPGPGITVASSAPMPWIGGAADTQSALLVGPAITQPMNTMPWVPLVNWVNPGTGASVWVRLAAFFEPVTWDLPPSLAAAIDDPTGLDSLTNCLVRVNATSDSANASFTLTTDTGFSQTNTTGDMDVPLVEWRDPITVEVTDTVTGLTATPSVVIPPGHVQTPTGNIRQDQTGSPPFTVVNLETTAVATVAETGPGFLGNFFPGQVGTAGLLLPADAAFSGTKGDGTAWSIFNPLTFTSAGETLSSVVPFNDPGEGGTWQVNTAFTGHCGLENQAQLDFDVFVRPEITSFTFTLTDLLDGSVRMDWVITATDRNNDILAVNPVSFQVDSIQKKFPVGSGNLNDDPVPLVGSMLLLKDNLVTTGGAGKDLFLTARVRDDTTRMSVGVDYNVDFVPGTPPPPAFTATLDLVYNGPQLEGAVIHHKITATPNITGTFTSVSWAWLNPPGPPNAENTWDPDLPANAGDWPTDGSPVVDVGTTADVNNAYTLVCSVTDGASTVEATAQFAPYDDPPAFSGSPNVTFRTNQQMTDAGLDPVLQIGFKQDRKGDDPEQGNNVGNFFNWTDPLDNPFTITGDPDWDYVLETGRFWGSTFVGVRHPGLVGRTFTMLHTVRDFSGNEATATFDVDFSLAPATP